MAFTDRQITLVGLLLCVLCFGYFCLLDQYFFSSAGFAFIFRVLLIEYDYPAALLSVLVCLCALFWYRPAPILRLVDVIAARPAATALGSVVALALGTIFVYHDYPFSMDEYAAVFQAKIFASARILAHLPPPLVDWLVLPGFNGSFLMASRETGLALEGYWPGFALLLAPFEWAGVPWLCNPLLGALAILLIFEITRKITGERRAGGWAVLFTLASGVSWGSGMSFYAMQAHATANLLFAWLLLSSTPKRALVAGAVGSLALVMHNPYPHALFAAPWVIGMALHRDERRCLPALIVGYVPLCLAVGVGWVVLRTDIAPPAHATTLVQGVMGGIFSWPDRALFDMRAASVAKMWVWSMPCLFLFAAMGYLQFRRSRPVILLMQSALLTFFGYLFVKLDQGHGWGYRYFQSAWGTIPILAGCAMAGAGADTRPRLVSFAGAVALLSLLVVVPFQLSEIHGMISRHLAMLPPPKRPGNDVYFIRPGVVPYGVDMIQNDPLLRAPDLILATRGPRLDAELIRQNWPDAVLVEGGSWFQQWYLGPADRRRRTPGLHEAHFVVGFVSPVAMPGNAPASGGKPAASAPATPSLQRR